MLRCDFFYDKLAEMGVGFFAGVPDSLLENFCAYITDHAVPECHVIAANEGNAVALACGHYLATGNTPLVYMQNSGQGNAVNPLVSLADPDVYGIPVLLLIGWRGQPGVKDEPQHAKQGRITESLLETLGIPYEIVPEEEGEAATCLGWIFETIRSRNAPAALIVRKGTFSPYKLRSTAADRYKLKREDALKVITARLSPTDIVVSTTGKISRELYEYRDERSEDHAGDFLTVGSMGHASQIALGIALARPDRQVICFDGDGAAIMHMGALAVAGSSKAGNFKHVIFNNGAHDSVGGQPTVGFSVSLSEIAVACGYRTVLKAQSKAEIVSGMREMLAATGPALLEIRINKGARSDLGRPKSAPKENKTKFMEFIRQCSSKSIPAKVR